MPTFSEKRLARNFYKTLRRFNVSPKAVADDGVHAAITLLATAQSITADIVALDVPRNVSIKGTKAGASLTGNVKIYGKNVDGADITETIAINTNDSEVLGLLAFKSVSRIDVPVRVTTADTVKIGFGKKIGFPEVIKGDCVLFASLNEVVEATRPAVVHGAEVHNCTFAPNSAPNGNELVVIYFVAP